MTIEEKAKAYDEALEKARMYRDNAKAVEEYAAVARYENIFPQLRESKNERIRQFLIERIISLYGADSVTPDGIAVNDIVSYLEKQKEPKYAPDALQKSFEAGQASIVDNPEQYGLCKKAEWSEEDEKMRTNAVLSLQYLIEEFPNADFIDSVKKEKAWLKSLCLQPKQEWSDEDEKMRSRILNIFACDQKHYLDETAWLQSLRPSWKPSEEQMKELKDASAVMKCDSDDNAFPSLKTLYEQLEKL